MADIVNLRQIRKRKARAEKERAADLSRAAHGITKAERERARLLNGQSRKLVDGHRRETSGAESGDHQE